MGNVAEGEIPLEDIDRTLAVNVRSVIVASQAVVKHMDRGGRIITIGSTNADRMPFQGGSVYAMSKAAIVGLTKGLARDPGVERIDGGVALWFGGRGGEFCFVPCGA